MIDELSTFSTVCQTKLNLCIDQVANEFPNSPALESVPIRVIDFPYHPPAPPFPLHHFLLALGHRS